jgi:signal transduction histidine kinase
MRMNIIHRPDDPPTRSQRARDQQVRDPQVRDPQASDPQAGDRQARDRQGRDRRIGRRHSLSIRLLLLTMGLVIVAEILVLIPNIARDRGVILREKVLEAYIAALSAAAPTEAPALAQRDELLRASGIEAIRMRDSRGTTMVLAGDPLARPAKTFDLRQETAYQSLIRSFLAITATEDVLVQIIADTPFKPGTEIEFVMHRAPLTQALRELDGPDAWMTLMVASMVALVLYLALLSLLVRPMRRLTSSIAAFRADPEHGVPFAPRAVTARRDDEISAAGRELAAMQRELHAALWRNNRLAALGTVVAKVSHDVRGILSPALLQADRLRKHADPAVRRAGDGLVQAVERAVDLVHRTLDFAREGPPPPLLTPIRLRALVAEAAESIRGAVALFELDNRIPPDQEVEADRNHLFRVLVNLLRNAAEAGATTVRARVRDDGDILSIELADDGPGLPEVVRANLFRPFTSTHRAGGSGLGLVIARDLMLAHGGDIGLVNTGAGGTTFRLTLKLTERADREPQAADEVSMQAQGD